MRFSSRCLTPLLGRRSSLGKEIRFSSRLRRARCKKHFHSRDNNSSVTIIPVLFLSTVQECVDRTNLQNTITNENREAAPRLRHRGVPATNLNNTLALMINHQRQIICVVQPTSHTCQFIAKIVCRDSKSLRLYQTAGPRPCRLAGQP